MKSMNGWIATPGFALLAMTNAGFFSSLLVPWRSGAVLLSVALDCFPSLAMTVIPKPARAVLEFATYCAPAH
jgi:hypothetical protein